MAEALALRPADKVLEIGAGSGYAAAVLSRVAREVWTIERHETLASRERERMGGSGTRTCTSSAATAPSGGRSTRRTMPSWWRRADPRCPRPCSTSSPRRPAGDPHGPEPRSRSLVRVRRAARR